MKKNTLVLIGLIGVAAFATGAALKYRAAQNSISADISEAALLNARLIEVVNGETQTTQLSEKLADLTVVNFWATWCAPCRHEMPMFESTYTTALAQDKSFTIVGVTIDSVDKATPMLDSMGITYPIVYAELTGNELMAVTGNPQGMLPYTLVLDAKGVVVEQKLGRVYQADLDQWIDAYL